MRRIVVKGVVNITLYNENGYLNMSAIRQLPVPWILVIGGRGTGKTYGAIDDIISSGKPVIWMRRTVNEINMVKIPELSDWGKWARAHHVTYDCVKLPGTQVSYLQRMEINTDGDVQYIGAPWAYLLSLATVSRMRGFSVGEVDIMYYDEFIPQRNVPRLRGEAEAIMAAYESVNRNRELEGRDPLKMICMSNSDDLANPLFVELGVVSVAERMQRDGRELYINKDRGLAIVNLTKSPISELKRDTALYRLTKGSRYAEMALDNKYGADQLIEIINRPLIEYRPIVNIGEITVYKHKSSGRYYVATHKTGSCKTYGSDSRSLDQVRHAYSHLRSAYLAGSIDYESSVAWIIFDRYFC